MIKKLLTAALFFILPFLIFSQSVGDYRSNVANGNWATLSSWQYYNGTSWMTPSGTAPQGYPGQFSGTQTVTILDGHTININGSTPSAFDALVVGGGTSGILIVGADVDVSTLSVTINTSALVKFSGSNFIRFPANTSVKINSPGKFDNGGVCNNNVAVYIGTVKFAVCKGSGNAEFTFDEINAGGGTILSSPSAASSTCQNETINLTGTASGAAGSTTSGGNITGINYSWTVTAPNSVVSTFSTQNPSFVASQTGTYTATLSCSTYYGTTLYSSSKSISIGVNTAPIITTPLVNQLDCEGSIVNFKVVVSGTGLSYTWQRKKPTDSAFMTILGGETNTTYPNTPINNEIRLVNVGSAQYPNGTQFQVVVSNGICSVASNIVVLSVNEIVAINSPTLVPSQSVVDVKLCYGSNFSYTAVISNPSNGPVTYQWKSQIPSGSWNNVLDGPHFSGATTAVLSIINGTPAESGKYRVDVIYNRTGGNCSVSSFLKVRSLTFYPSLTTPVVTISQPDCTTNTGTIALTVQSATDVYSFNNGLTYQASTTKSGLTAGNYNVIIKNTAGCLSPTIIVPINPVVTNKWTGSWSTGANPVTTEKIEFAGNYTATVDVVGCSCEVLSGSVTFNMGTKLTLTNDLKVTGGSLTFEDSASLVQINSVTNSGNINYKRATQSVISNFDYTYWSSPVSPQTLFNVSPQTLGDKFYSFNGAAASWVQEPSSTVMAKGVGYIIRGPQNFAAPNPPSIYQATFIGVPNNGNIDIIIGTAGEASYLLGNPYPSALDAESFMKNNPLLVGALYFWTHATKIGAGTSNLGSGSLAYTSDDYALFNLTGSAAASSGGAIPNGKIGSGQGFFVTTIGSGTVNFNNTMRVGVGLNTGDNAQFFKTQSNAKVAIAEKNRLWLDFYNKQGAFKQALIGYVSGATNTIDAQFDGESFDANEYVDFYSISNEKKFVIQGRAVPFDRDDKVILGFKTTIAGEFTIKINQVDGLFATQEVFIEDKMLNKIHDLKKGEYTFTADKGTFNDRFVLFYTNKKAVTATITAEAVSKLVLVSSSEKEIRITASLSIRAVMLYDSSGKEIFNKTKVNSTELAIRNLRKGNTIYVVKIKLDNGQTLTQKVIY